MKKLEVINFLRGFAIFTIVLIHCVQGHLEGVMHKAASLGGAGVHVFILCSGFGLYLSYMNKPMGYLDFLKVFTCVADKHLVGYYSRMVRV